MKIRLIESCWGEFHPHDPEMPTVHIGGLQCGVKHDHKIKDGYQRGGSIMKCCHCAGDSFTVRPLKESCPYADEGYLKGKYLQTCDKCKNTSRITLNFIANRQEIENLFIKE